MAALVASIVMNSGERFEVPHPGAAVAKEGQLVLVVSRSNSMAYLRLNQISHVVVNDLWDLVEDD